MIRTFKIHIKTEDESEVKEKLREVTYLAVGMREWQKKWKAEYGAQNKFAMKEWEKRMDDWIDKHKVYYDAD